MIIIIISVYKIPRLNVPVTADIKSLKAVNKMT